MIFLAVWGFGYILVRNKYYWSDTLNEWHNWYFFCYILTIGLICLYYNLRTTFAVKRVLSGLVQPEMLEALKLKKSMLQWTCVSLVGYILTQCFLLGYVDNVRDEWAKVKLELVV